jgi:hypothetical protein
MGTNNVFDVIFHEQINIEKIKYLVFGYLGIWGKTQIVFGYLVFGQNPK